MREEWSIRFLGLGEGRGRVCRVWFLGGGAEGRGRKVGGRIWFVGAKWFMIIMMNVCNRRTLHGMIDGKSYFIKE